MNKLVGINAYSDLVTQVNVVTLINKEVFEVRLMEEAPTYITAKTERERVEAALKALYSNDNIWTEF
jgi:hypothetical protein